MLNLAKWLQDSTWDQFNAYNTVLLRMLAVVSLFIAIMLFRRYFLDNLSAGRFVSRATSTSARGFRSG